VSEPRATPSRILLIQLRRLGDMVITTALLEDLRHAFPGARLDFMTRAAIAPVLREHPLINEILSYDRSRPTRMWAETRARRYDWVIDSESSPRSALLTRASGARVRVGWSVTGWKVLYTHRVSRRSGRPPEYVVLDRQRLLEAVGVPVSWKRPRLYLTEQERRNGASALAAIGAPDGMPRAALVLSSGSPSRQWPVEHFAAVARALAADGAWPIVFEMPGDSRLVAQFRTAAPAISVVPVADIRAFMCMLSACGVLIAANTGPVHVATALDVPTVTAFGADDPAGWSPRIAITAGVRGDVASCPECARRARGLMHSCVTSVRPEAMLALAREYLDLGAGAAAEAPHGSSEGDR
jgi:ADP-heptose:LPS heptosyltransferase